ncbi:MAG: 30S ribosomal protein S20 [Chthonomonadales bacterium]|nr:30S ribosomal protein S20 [Chthonomonadales bacterium]
MPNIKSVVKDVKKSRANRLRNISTKSAIKTFVKKAKAVMDAGDAAQTEGAVRAAVSIIDKAVERGIIHRNAGARRKSRLMRRANKASQTLS